MSIENRSLKWLGLGSWGAPEKRRWLPLLTVLTALTLIGFYTVTDVERLSHSALLTGSDWIGYAFCHRITERSFVINGRQLPLCARCTGMYLGVALTLVVMSMSGRLKRGAFPPLPIMLLLVGFIGLMGIDGTNSYLHFFPNAPHLYQPRNWLRLLTGFGTGLAMGVMVLPALAQTLWRDYEDLRSIGSWKEMALLLAAAGLLIFLVLSGLPVIMFILAVASTLGLLAVVTAIQTVLILILLRKDGKGTRWSHAAAPLAIGMILSLFEIGIVGYFRYGATGTMTGFPGI